MSFSNLFKISYFIDPNIGYFFAGETFLIGILLGLVVFTFYFNRKFKNLGQDKLLRHPLRLISSASLWLGFGGLLWLFFRYQEVQILNLRLWFALLCLYFLSSIVYALHFVLFRYPVLQEVRERKTGKARFLKMAYKKKR